MAKFNPYRKWLNLDSQITAPNYYRLLGLEDLEEDPEVIRAAAEATLARIQSCDPGPRAKRWGRLVAEVEQAGQCLTDEWTKGDYDRQLDLSVFAPPQPVESADPPAPQETPPVEKKLTSQFKLAPETTNLEASLLPPGMGGAAMVTPAKTPPPEPPSDTSQEAIPNTPEGSSLVFHAVPDGQQDAVPDGQQDAVPEGREDAVPEGQQDGPQNSDTEIAETAADAEIPAIVDPAPTSANDELKPDPGIEAITFNQISPPESNLTTQDAVDVTADPALPTTNPMSAYQAPQTIEVAQVAAPDELSDGDIPVAIALQSSELQDAPIAQLTASPNASTGSVEVPSGPPPPPRLRQPAPPNRGRQLAVGAGLVVCIGILAFVWFNSEPDETVSVANRSSAEASIDLAAEAASDPQPSDPQPSDPQPSDPQPSDPQPSDPQPSDPQPSDPQPSDPQPSDPQPSDPQPSDPQPSDPQPPSKQQLTNLGQALGMARTALGKGGIKSSERASARKYLKRAATLAELPQHKDLVRRLTLLANYVEQFWATLDRVLRGFQGGEELSYRDSIILVREKPTDELKIRYKGLNLSHRLTQLPPGIVMAIANHGFDEAQPVNQVLKGAFLVVHPTSSESKIADARRWWEEAANSDVEIGDLVKVIDDDYLLKLPSQSD